MVWEGLGKARSGQGAFWAWHGLAWHGLAWHTVWKGTFRAGHGFGKGTASAVPLKAAKNAGFSP
jgi:hypothetical protein